MRGTCRSMRSAACCKPIYLAGAANKGGKLLFGATWSIDAGDGIDDKCVFVTDLGEVLIFTGSNPSDAANWRQEGRYQIGAPLGMNAHMLLGGDLLIATVDGIVPVSQAIQQGQRRARAGAAHPQHQAAVARRGQRQARLAVDDEELGRVRRHLRRRAGRHHGGQQALPGRQQRDRRVVHLHLGRRPASCGMREDMFFGTQNGIDHAGRPHRLRRRPALHGDAGRRLGDVPVRRRADDLAPGARHLHLALQPSRSSRN